VSSVAQDKKRGQGRQPNSRDEDANPATEESPLVARRRVFLLLEAHRESLGAQLWRRVRVRRRYEDLCLVKMVTRLERDYLSQPGPGFKQPGDGLGQEYGVADWARPWGPTFLLQFQADLNVFDRKLKSARRWLSAATQREAEAQAARRFTSITASLASELKAAQLTLPVWASGRHPSRELTKRRSQSRGAFRRGAYRRAVRFNEANRAARPAPKPVAPERRGPRSASDGRRLNLNQARFTELRALNLSTTQSHRVLAYRKRIGRYESVDQLDDVPGFPEAVREQLKRQVTV
jgi:DNA uptake protein ComE-like DNA-binding protein